jgi:hypothetical protein
VALSKDDLLAAVQEQGVQDRRTVIFKSLLDRVVAGKVLKFYKYNNAPLVAADNFPDKPNAKAIGNEEEFNALGGDWNKVVKK